MKTSNTLIVSLSFFALILFLSGCINTSHSKTLKINNPENYEGILVSGASSLLETSGYEEILVSGEDKAGDLISVLNGEKLVAANEKELQEKIAELKEPGSYRVLLYNKPSIDSTSEDIYPILFYQDGTIQVNQEGISYFLTNPPKDLLIQLKSDWDINF